MNIEIKEFYDEFAKSKLLRDFQVLNLRQEAIRGLCRKFVPKGAKILEIGCGVGILTRELQKYASLLVAVDISDENIRIARQYATTPNTNFHVADVLEQDHLVDQYSPFDVVAMFDVIEHMSQDKRPVLLSKVEQVLVKGGIVLLTFPSPGYQRYLREYQPDALQIVDEIVVPSQLMQETRLSVRHLEYKDVWMSGQYIHLVLQSGEIFQPGRVPKSRFQRVVSRFRNRIWRLRNHQFVKKVRHDFENGA